MGIAAAALLWAVALPLTPAELSPSLQAAISVPGPPASQEKPSGLSEKESLMLLFGKGNGAMRAPGQAYALNDYRSTEAKQLE
jgi:hypothetical protein